MRKLQALFCLLSLVISVSVYPRQATEPDFAYPADVAAAARTSLSAADALAPSQAGPARLLALEELSRALSAIDGDSIPALISLTDSLISQSGNVSEASMLWLFKARLLAGLGSGHWVQPRIIPEEVAVDEEAMAEEDTLEPDLWSPSYIRGQILAAVDSASALAPATSGSLAPYGQCITCDSVMRPYLSSVADYIAVAGSGILRSEGMVLQADSLLDRAREGVPASSPFGMLCNYLMCRDPGAMARAYARYSSLEPARIFLLDMRPSQGNPSDLEQTRRYVASEDSLAALIRTSLARFPLWVGNAALRAKLAALRQPVLMMEMPSIVPVRAQCLLKGFCFRGHELKVKIYEEAEPSVLRRNPNACTPMAVYDLDLDSGGEEFSIEMAFDMPATYLIVAEIDGTVCNNYIRTTATPGMPSMVNIGESVILFCADPTDGRPLRNCRFGLDKDALNGHVGSTINLGSTHGNGFLTLSLDSIFTGRNTFRITCGDDTVPSLIIPAPPRYSPRPATERVELKLLTSRPVYHFGDTVQWSVVAERTVDANMSPAPDLPISLTSYLPGGNQLDNGHNTTDASGCASGSFVLPSEGLAGEVTLAVDGGNGYTSSSFLVSDFALPTFEIDSIAVTHPEPNGVVVRGRAINYSGVPVGGAVITLNASERASLWMDRYGMHLSATAVSDSAGFFMLEVQTGHSGHFGGTLRAVAPSGESVTAPIAFATGKPYRIEAELQPSYNGVYPCRIPVMVFGGSRTEPGLPLEWNITDSEASGIARGDVLGSDTLEIDLSPFPAGKYTFHCRARDEAMADSVYPQAFVLYNTARNEVPDVNWPFYLPESSANSSGSSTTVTLGIPGREPLWVYCFEDIDGRAPAAWRRRLNPGFHRLKVKNGNKNAAVIFLAVRDGKAYSGDFRIYAKTNDTLSIKPENPATALLPGAPSLWTFRLSGPDGRPAAGARMSARMFNRSLSSIYRQPSLQPFHRGQPMPWVNVDMWWYGADRLQEITRPGGFNMTMPGFRYMERPLRSRYVLYGSVTNAMATADYGAEMKSEACTEEDCAPAGGAPDVGGEILSDITMRENEVLQGFFYPCLQADPNGRVALPFTAPRTIGGWQFEAFGWAPDGRSGTLALEAQTALPVMVQMHSPRFLRTGDTATMSATITNNTTETTRVRCLLEALSQDAHVLSQCDTFLTVAAGSQAMVEQPFTAPAIHGEISLRVRITDGVHSDGEQRSVAVLENAFRIIESEEFYFAPEPGERCVNPGIDVRPGLDYFLEYCSNPVFNIARDLRETSPEMPVTATALASEAFALNGLHSICCRMPAFEEIFNRAPVPAISSNDSLKYIPSFSTPWGNSESKNQYLRPDSLVPAARQRGAALANLQGSTGGFAWGPFDREPSEWATATVLGYDARARFWGLAPILEDATAAKAWEWFCARTLREPSYLGKAVFIHTLAPVLEFNDSTAPLAARYVDSLSVHWRNLPIAAKARGAVILQCAGLAAEAQAVLASLRQHSVVHPGMGMEFPRVNSLADYADILMAYQLLGAPCGETDAIRQWIILHSQTGDRLADSRLATLTAAIMGTGTDWTADEPLKVNLMSGQTLTLNGYGLLPLIGNPPALEICASGPAPAYGALTGTGMVGADSIAAGPGRDISLSRRLLALRNGSWTNTTSFIRGERVKVQIIVRAHRNLQYLTITDARAAGLVPVLQRPQTLWAGGIPYYLENRTTATNVFITDMPSGTYCFEYETTASFDGQFSQGAASVQSQYDPAVTAHSGATHISIQP